jgi:hypothetical protein
MNLVIPVPWSSEEDHHYRENTYVRTFGRGVRLSLLRRHSVLTVVQLEHGSLRSHFTFLAWQESHCMLD